MLFVSNETIMAALKVMNTPISDDVEDSDD
jgi:hypothetical protein